MRKAYIECDNCGSQDQIEPALYGGESSRWITVTKSLSQSKEKLTAGTHHFCCEECLFNYKGIQKQE